MTNEQQALADMPIWLVILLAVVGGVSGEMWRADKEGARGWPLLRRLALRSGACMICGVSAIMLLYAAGMSIWAAGCAAAMPFRQRLWMTKIRPSHPRRPARNKAAQAALARAIPAKVSRRTAL